MKEKLMNCPTETEHEAMGQRQRTEDHGKVIFASGFFWLSYIPHLRMHLEKSLWTIWNFSMISAEKVSRSFGITVVCETKWSKTKRNETK